MQQPAGPPPPAGFEAYKKNAASGGVMGMIEQIIQDAKAMEAEAIRSEADAQKAYEGFVKETNASIEEKSKDIVNKSETKAKAETDLVTAKEDKESTMLELEQLSNYNAELHQSCDFVLKNFEVRQTARSEDRVGYIFGFDRFDFRMVWYFGFDVVSIFPQAGPSMLLQVRVRCLGFGGFAMLFRFP